MPDQETLTQLSTAFIAIVGPIIAYFKAKGDSESTTQQIANERQKTAERRDAVESITEKRLSDLEKKVIGIDELKDSIQQINIALAKIQTLIEIYIAKVDK